GDFALLWGRKRSHWRLDRTGLATGYHGFLSVLHSRSEALLLQLATRDAVRENISVSSKPFHMAETPEATGARTNTSAGHLSVHVDGDHPVEVPFLFDQ